jgi:hypothetical protein
MCHSALEQFLGLEIPDRNLTVLHNLYRNKDWAQHRTTDTDIVRPIPTKDNDDVTINQQNYYISRPFFYYIGPLCQ